MQFDSEKFVIYDEKGKKVKNIQGNIFCPYLNEDKEKIGIEEEKIKEEEEESEIVEEEEKEKKNEISNKLEEEDELYSFYEAKNKGKVPKLTIPTQFPNYPLKIEENNLAIQILKEESKCGNSINGLNFIGLEYMTSKEQFHEDIIYLSRLRDSSEVFMLYFSKKKKNLFLKLFHQLIVKVHLKITLIICMINIY